MYHLCSKGADQLGCYHAADLLFCFSHKFMQKKQVFSWQSSNMDYKWQIFEGVQIVKINAL